MFGRWIEISNRPGRYNDGMVPSTASGSDDTAEPPLIDVKNHDGISFSDGVGTVGELIQPREVVNDGTKCRHETTDMHDNDSIVAVFV